MNRQVYNQILELASEHAMRERTAAYLTEQLRPIVGQGEPVLLCFHQREDGDLCSLMEQAVLACGGRPVPLGEDHRWKTILRQAFTSRAVTVVGTPCVVLGLCKLKKAMSIPLYIRNVITAGYPCTDWMKDGIAQALDCRIFSTMGLFTSGVVAGFSCGHGIHLRTSEYEIQVLDPQGRPLPDGELGRWQLWPVGRPELSICPGEYGRMDRSPCPCGRPGPRLVDRRHWDAGDRQLADMAESLLSWTSILDFSLRRSRYGLELEMVVFPGEKLPKLPACARQVIRPWDPETDEPFPDVPVRKNIAEYPDYH
ncbi:MAG: hypothetical protein Q4F17_05605 [Eubacteriales bacterium]|nr:hypothetical protein [Eubacteriales bacterium]